MPKKPLIIVESPTKVKTLQKFLGSQYICESSVGHIRDLPKKGMGIDIENHFEPTYEIMPDKKDVIQKLKKAAKNASIVYLAPDPDREGEAIAWHIQHVLPKGVPVKRVTFHAITKNSVLSALDNPREIDYSLVDAQQARRLLDRLVGYKISPILQRRIQTGRAGTLSAGRVQSVALKLVVDREKEIEAFVSEEYWKILVSLENPADGNPILTSLYSIENKKIDSPANATEKSYIIRSEQEALEIKKDLSSQQVYLKNTLRREKVRKPQPPFITSTLQQEASRHFGFSASRTMSIAQSLYEGIDMGAEGQEGLITYMRTDSVRSAPEAIQELRRLISRQYGNEYLPEKATSYSTKKSAQDAHEAIRPTNLTHPPEFVRPFMSEDQYKLYSLIWKRFIASQMKPAIYDTVSYDFHAGPRYMLRATGSVIKFLGYLAVYQEKIDEGEEEEEKRLPNLTEGEVFELSNIDPQQSFTKPPPRFTEASLVKELEKCGIGRPSTYASIMNKIQSRDYTIKEKRYLKPTELGQLIAMMLENHFKLIMDISFTAKMEEDLDVIVEHYKDWRDFLEEFWKKFFPIVQDAEKNAIVPKMDTDLDCPKCGSKLQKIWAKGKYFYGCSAYPDCDYTAPIQAMEFDRSKYAENFNWDQKCPLCDAEMVVRHGKFGAFLGCSRYPDCKGIVNIPLKGEDLPPEKMPDCPAIGCDGKMVQRRSRFGKVFFSCSNYPDCDVIVNHLDDLEEKYQNHPKTPYVKKTKTTKKTAKKAAKKTSKKTTKKTAKKTKKASNQPAYQLSAELSAVVGAKELSRGEVTKKIWDYIKEHQLQDPENKRKIVPDETLAKVFGSKESIDMMQIAKKISPHLSKPE